MQNLAAEMARNGLRLYDIQRVINCSESTVRNKMSGTTEFSINEAFAIRDTFFPALRIEYLFSEAKKED